MGPLKQVMKLMPGMGSQTEGMQLDGDELESMEAIINSMTPRERDNPSIIEASRRRRIARGSGTEPQDVSGMIKSFGMASNMMKQMAGMGMQDRMRFAKQMGEMGSMGMTPAKVKKRSKRLSKKQRAKRKRKKKGRKR